MIRKQKGNNSETSKISKTIIFSISLKTQKRKIIGLMKSTLWTAQIAQENPKGYSSDLFFFNELETIDSHKQLAQEPIKEFLTITSLSSK